MYVYVIVAATLVLCINGEFVSRFELEKAVGGPGTDFSPWRSRASRTGSLHMYYGDILELKICPTEPLSLQILSLHYSNDGPSDRLTVSVDKMYVGTVVTEETIGGWGRFWNDVKESGYVGSSAHLHNGDHIIWIEVTSADIYGTEIDAIDIVTDVIVDHDQFWCGARLIIPKSTTTSTTRPSKLTTAVFQSTITSIPTTTTTKPNTNTSIPTATKTKSTTVQTTTSTATIPTTTTTKPTTNTTSSIATIPTTTTYIGKITTATPKAILTTTTFDSTTTITTSTTPNSTTTTNTTTATTTTIPTTTTSKPKTSTILPSATTAIRTSTANISTISNTVPTTTTFKTTITTVPITTSHVPTTTTSIPTTIIPTTTKTIPITTKTTLPNTTTQPPTRTTTTTTTTTIPATTINQITKTTTLLPNTTTTSYTKITTFPTPTTNLQTTMITLPTTITTATQTATINSTRSLPTTTTAQSTFMKTTPKTTIPSNTTTTRSTNTTSLFTTTLTPITTTTPPTTVLTTPIKTTTTPTKITTTQTKTTTTPTKTTTTPIKTTTTQIKTTTTQTKTTTTPTKTTTTPTKTTTTPTKTKTTPTKTTTTPTKTTTTPTKTTTTLTKTTTTPTKITTTPKKTTTTPTKTTTTPPKTTKTPIKTSTTPKKTTTTPKKTTTIPNKTTTPTTTTTTPTTTTTTPTTTTTTPTTITTPTTTTTIPETTTVWIFNFVKQNSVPAKCIDTPNVNITFTPISIRNVEIYARARKNLKHVKSDDVGAAFDLCPRKIWRLGNPDGSDAEFGANRDLKDIVHSVNVPVATYHQFPKFINTKHTETVTLEYLVPSSKQLPNRVAFLTIGLLQILKDVTIGVQYFTGNTPSKTQYQTFTPEQTELVWEIPENAVIQSRVSKIRLLLDKAVSEPINFDFMRFEYEVNRFNYQHSKLVDFAVWEIMGVKFRTRHGEDIPRGMSLEINNGRTMFSFAKVILLRKPLEKILTIDFKGNIYPYHGVDHRSDNADKVDPEFTDVSGIRLRPVEIKVSKLYINTMYNIVTIAYDDGVFVRISFSHSNTRTMLKILYTNLSQNDIYFFSTKFTDNLAAVNRLDVDGRESFDILDEMVNGVRGQWFNFQKTTSNPMFESSDEISLFFPRENIQSRTIIRE